MNKVILSSGAIMLLLLASCGGNDSTDVSVSTSSPAPWSTLVEVNQPVFLAQWFADYDESLVGETENTVLFFHQESCGTCKATEKSLIEDGGIPSNLQVLKIDIDADSSVALKQKYGVTMKHTFVQIDSDGNLIKKWNGSMNADDINMQVGGDAMMKQEDDSMMDKSEDETMMKKDEEVMEKDDAMMEKDTAVEVEVMEKVELSGVYADYDTSLVGNTENTVVFFHAAWCPSCRAADDAISAESVTDGLTILKADFDSSTDLRKKYDVVAQHTFVQIDADGNEIKKWLGGNSVSDIEGRLQ